MDAFQKGHASEDESDRYKILFNTMIEGVVHQDADGKIISMNPAAVEILGKTPEDFLGQTSVGAQRDTIREDGSLFPGLEHPSIVALKTGKKVLDVPMGVYNPREKRFRWITISAIPVFKQGSNDPYEVYTVFKDVTDQRLHEMELERSETKYRSVVQSAPYGMHFYELMSDGRLVLTGANKSAGQILKMNHARLIGKTIEEAFPGLAGSELYKIYKKVAETGEPWQSERVDYYEGRIAGAFNVFAFQTSPGSMAAAFMDITERIRVEETAQALVRDIREEKDRLAALINSMSDEVWFARKDGKFVLANPPAMRTFLVDPASKEVNVDQMARSLEVLRPDGSPRPMDETPPLRALQGEIVKNEVEIVRVPDTGELRYRQVTATPVRDAAGEIIGSVSVVRDVTERKLAEDALRNTTEYLEKLITYANAPIIVWDTSFKITRFNRAFERMTGYAAREVIGKDLSMLFPSDSKDESLGLIAMTLSGERWESVEIPIRRTDNSVRVALWNSANIYEEDGQTLAATIAQGQDITERKEAEAALQEYMRILERSNENLEAEKDKLQFIVDSLPVAVGLYDGNGRRILANTHVDRIWRGSLGPIGSMADFDKYVGYDSKTGMRLKPSEWPIAVVLATGEPVHNQEIDIVRMDRTTATILASAVPAKDDTGATTGAIIAYIDISAQKEVEKELARSNTELQSFAYAASHDLREPLRTISGFLEILSTDYGDRLDNDAKDYIQRAVNASNRLHIMIDDLLFFSRLETRKKPFRTVNLDETLSVALADLNKTLAEHGASVTSDPLPTVWADDQQMAIVFRNLIDNGIKFHRKEPPKVRITAKKRGDEWLICFQDNGIGIDDKFYGKIFNMFTRLHSRTEYPGTGIGLAMCKKIIERHGGRIWVESELGKGSAFFFTMRDLGQVSHQVADIESWTTSSDRPSDKDGA